MRITNQGELEFVQHRTPMNLVNGYTWKASGKELKSFRAWDTSSGVIYQYLFVYVLCSANALVIRSLSSNMSCSSFSISDSLYSSSA
jgi:hypothetical protein